jgi:NADH dehydrogenase
MTKHICILGGGFGGLYTCLSLNRTPLVRAGKAKITLVEQKDHFLFTPLLYELITGELQRWEIAPSYQKLLHDTNINLCQDKIINVDLNKCQVKLNNHPNLNYDYLVLALGRKNRYAPIPGLTTHALKFRTLEDVELLNQRLHLLETSSRQRLRVAVIGGGPNGVEIAGKISDRLGQRGEIYLIERGQSLLKNFSVGVQKASGRALAARKIQVIYNSELKAIEAGQVILVRQRQTVTIPTDLVLWAAGTQSLEWLLELDCQKNSQGKLTTYPTLQLVDYPEVFALGDLANIPHRKLKPVPATAQAAYQQAGYVAKNIQRIMEGKSLKHFHYFHLGDMLTLGKKVAVVSSFGVNLEGALADKIRRLAYIQRLPTFRHRWQVLKNVVRNSLSQKLSSLGWQLQRLFTQKSAKKYPQDT